MLCSEIMSVGASRASYTTQVSSFRDRARIYLNDSIDELLMQSDWRWRLKSGTLTTADGTKEYDLAADVMFPVDVVDSGNAEWVTWRTPRWVDWEDPDSSREGQPQCLVPVGMNNTTGRWSVRVFPTPDAVYTLPYRYWMYVPKVENGGTIDDSTDLDLYIPRHLQQVLYLWISYRFFGAKGANDAAEAEYQRGMRIVQLAKTLNARDPIPTSLGYHNLLRTNSPVDFFISNDGMTVTV